MQGVRVPHHPTPGGNGTQAQGIPTEAVLWHRHAQKPHGLSIAALSLWGKYGNHLRTHDSGLCLGVEESGFFISYLPGYLEISAPMGFGHSGKLQLLFSSKETVGSLESGDHPSDRG